MNMMPQGLPGAMDAPAPFQMPSEEEIEEAKIIAEACTWEEVSSILRSDERRSYTIDIETTATSFEDDAEEKQRRIEFMGAMTQWLSQAIPAIQANPSMAPLMKELTMFSVGAFKIGRTLEESFEDSFDQIQNMPPQPNPEAEKLKAEQAMKEKELQASMAEKQADAQLKAQESQQKIAFEQEKFGLERQKMELELSFKSKEMEFKERELAMKAQNDAFAMDLQRENARFEQGIKWEDHQLRGQEVAFKREDAEANRAMAADDRNYERTKEKVSIDEQAEKVFSENGETLRTEVVEMIASLSEQLMGTAQQLGEQNMMIAQALQGISQQQDEMTDGFTKVVSHMTAPRKVKRDEKTGRAIGVEVGESDASDLKQMLERLTSGQKQIMRDKSGRVEAFA